MTNAINCPFSFILYVCFSKKCPGNQYQTISTMLNPSDEWGSCWHVKAASRHIRLFRQILSDSPSLLSNSKIFKGLI